MTDKQMQAELEALRAEVAALSKARTEARRTEATETTGKSTDPGPEAASGASAFQGAATVDLEDPEALKGQLDQLLAQLEHEIRDMPTITTLAVFALGVLFGRLLK